MLAITQKEVVVRENVVVQVLNFEDQDSYLKWEGSVTQNVLRIDCDGESVIVSDQLLPLHGQPVTVIVLPVD